MTPKEILKEMVRTTYHCVNLDDLTDSERKIGRMLVREGILIIKEYIRYDLDDDYSEYRMNNEYFVE
jgi:hypothetical protein